MYLKMKEIMIIASSFACWNSIVLCVHAFTTYSTRQTFNRICIPSNIFVVPTFTTTTTTTTTETLAKSTTTRQGSGCNNNNKSQIFQRTTRLYLASAPKENEDGAKFLSDDPFEILGLSKNQQWTTMDASDIKRAYRKAALRYHPDVTTNRESTEAEKKLASDRFAKINWAYQTLMNGQKQKQTTASAQSSSSKSSSTGWQPPHRRASSSSSSTGSTDWRDYVPNYNRDESYDTGGDSFEKIFSDLFQGAAQGVARAATSSGSSGGIFKDFVEFLEQTVDGYGTSSSSSGTDEDRELQVLLRSNSIEDVGEEMDETEIVVRQLEQKKNNLKLEILQVQADLANSQSYSETMEYQSRFDELNARQDVVHKYLQKARKRLLQLQTKYKELIVVQGQNDPRAGGRTSRSYSREPPSPSASSSSSSTSTQSSSRKEGTSDDDWKREGFGSFGGVGQRGSSRRHRRSSESTRSGSTATSSTSANSRRYESPRSTASTTTARTSSTDVQSSSSSSPSSSTSTTNSSSPYVPPHRRPSDQSLKDDATRLREIKVEEEFDKLKKELGL